VLSVVGDVPVNGLILRFCWPSLPKCSKRLGLHACVHSDKCACVVCVSDVLCNLKKITPKTKMNLNIKGLG
jgi:hypothetical protein